MRHEDEWRALYCQLDRRGKSEMWQLIVQRLEPPSQRSPQDNRQFTKFLRGGGGLLMMLTAINLGIMAVVGATVPPVALGMLFVLSLNWAVWLWLLINRYAVFYLLFD